MKIGDDKIIKEKSTKEKILDALGEETCALMECKDIIKQNLREVIKDKTNTIEVIGQAKILLQLGFKETDYFCQNCFWK